jgi:hypothetical protein
MPREELDNPVLNKIREGIQRWTKHKLSSAGKVLIINQVILASIWYIVLCSAYSGTAMKKISGLIRDYMWCKKEGKRTRAKLKWNTTILPLTAGGIKVLDPEL